LSGITARIIVDDSMERSKVSLAFVNQNNIPCSMTSSGPVVVLADRGWVHSIFAMQVVSDISSDIIVGRTGWLHAVWNVLMNI
jgi:hypothetical protein